MDAWLNREIKAVIKEHPAIEQILMEYGVGCGACTVGSCLVKEIVTIHALSPAQEKELMARFALVFSGEVEKALAMKGEAKPVRIIYSTPVQNLVDEHVVIMRWIRLIPKVAETLNLENPEHRELMTMGIEMIRTYADRLHHAKEEDILFEYTDRGAEIIAVMYEDHKRARSHVQAMIKAVEARDSETAASHLTAYGELLTEHIKKEDEILYPYIDRNLSGAQIRELIDRFAEAETRLAVDTEKYTSWLDEVESQYK